MQLNECGDIFTSDTDFSHTLNFTSHRLTDNKYQFFSYNFGISMYIAIMMSGLSNAVSWQIH
jgi:hypothetical protein